MRLGQAAPWITAACAASSLVAYGALFAYGWGAVALLGDDGIRVRPVSRTGLVVTAILPGSAAAGKDLALGNAIDGVDGLVTRDERALLRAFASRPAGRESRLHIQDITPGGGTGAGMGATRVVTTVPRPRLGTPAVSTSLRVVGVAGCVAIVAAIVTAIRFSGRRAAWSAVLTAGAVAGLMLSRVLAEANPAGWLLIPPLLAVGVASTSSLVLAMPRRRVLAAATAAAVVGGTASLLLTITPGHGLDPRYALVAADVGLASFALIPTAAALTPAHRE